MQRYTNFIASTTATNSTLTVLSNASCVVYIAGTLGAATLYSDNGVTPLANPFLSSATGRIDFYAANGRYDVVVSKVGYLTVTISDIELDDLLAPSGSNSVGYLPAGTGAVASTVQTKLRESVSVKDFGAVGDGVADDTAAFNAFLVAGGGVVTTGTYIVGAVTVSATVKVTCLKSAIIKQKSGTASANWITFTSGATDSEWSGGAFDGNKANQTFSISVAAIRLNTVSGVKINATIQNTICNPITTTDCDRLNLQLFTDNCNGVASLARSDDSDVSIRSKGVNNNGQAIYQHAVDYSDFTNSRLSAVVTGQVGDASGLSTFASGITLVRNSRCHYSLLSYTENATVAVYTLGVSFVGGINCTGDAIFVEKTRQALEFAGLQNSVFASVFIDGKYWTTTATPSADSLTGIIIHAGAQYSPSAVSAANSGTSGVHIGVCKILRCGTGVYDNTGGVIFGTLSSKGNTLDGYRSLRVASNTAYFPGSTSPQIEKPVLGTVVLTGNGRAGVMLDDCQFGLSIAGGVIANNGQDTTYTATQRAGLAMQTAGFKQKIIVSGCDIFDTQTYTKTLAATYNPGVTDVKNQFQFSVLSPGLFDIGERITLTDVLTGPASATGKIVDIDKDEFTVEFAAATTFVDLLSASTGTVSSSGVTLTGAGTLFTTELIGRCWIKAAGEYRQIMKVTSDTVATLSAAFGTPLSGAAYSRIRANIVGIPSQQYGVYWDANATGINLGANNYADNVVANMGGSGTPASLPEIHQGGAELTVLQSGTFAASTVTNVYGSIPPGYEIVGYRFQITSAVTGTTGSSIGLALFGGSAQVLGSGIGVTLNTRNEGNVVPERLTANTQLRATFSGGADNVPDGGTYRAELRVRRASFAAFASV